MPDMEMPNMNQMPESQMDQSVHEISQNYEGAPELVSSFLLLYTLAKFNGSSIITECAKLIVPFDSISFENRFKKLKFNLRDEPKLSI